MQNIVTLKKLRENMQKEELWEEVIDFTKIERGGVDIDEILKRL